MPLMRPLGAVLRLVRIARGLSQEEFSGAVEARHIHNLEYGKTSVTIGTLETLAGRLEVDPIALLAYASRLERNVSPEQYMETLQEELQKISRLGVDEQIRQQYQEGDELKPKTGRRTDPAKLAAVKDAKASGKTKRETSEALGIPRSTVNDLWEKV
ncbi:XRE family transcriptional regulator [Pseudomonas donghuensis]|nr:XRE family transcriptional regulator [Pseudomonas donghuensis]